MGDVVERRRKYDRLLRDEDEYMKTTGLCPPGRKDATSASLKVLEAKYRETSFDFWRENRRLRAALEKYGSHCYVCDSMLIARWAGETHKQIEARCNCGFNEALKGEGERDG